jgi:hypothetical protein
MRKQPKFNKRNGLVITMSVFLKLSDKPILKDDTI